MRRFKVSRAFAKRVKEILGDAPDVVFEHVGQATFPTSVFVVKPFGKVVICGATSGFQLDFDVRYLWMRQKQIIGSHFANAWEATKANELIEESKVRPVLWQTMPFDQVANAHQGHVHVLARPGGGTIFRVLLPTDPGPIRTWRNASK